MFPFFLPVAEASLYSSEVSQYLARVTIADETTKSAVVALIDGLVTDSIWTKLDVLAVAQDTQASSLTNLKSSSYTQVAYGTPTFTVNRGFALDTSAKYIDTVVVPLAGGINCQSNSNSLTVYNRNNVTTGTIAGSYGYPPQLEFELSISTGGTGLIILDGFDQAEGVPARSPVYAAAVGGMGFLGMSRESATAVHNDFRGLTVSRTVASTTTLPQYSVFIGAQNDSGVAIVFAATAPAAWTVGGGLSSTELGNLRTRIDTYMTAIGANV